MNWGQLVVNIMLALAIIHTNKSVSYLTDLVERYRKNELESWYEEGNNDSDNGNSVG